MIELGSILSKHSRHYDAVDNIRYGCVCPEDSSCEVIVLIDAYHKAQQNEIKTLKEFKAEQESFAKEKRTLLAEIAGLENYNKKLVEIISGDKPQLLKIESYFSGGCPRCMSNKREVRLPVLEMGLPCSNSWHDSKE